MEANAIAGLAWGWLTELAMPWLALAITTALAYARKWKINDTVLKAVARGAGAAYLTMLEERRGTAGLAQAVDAGAAYVEQRLPATLVKAGLDTDSVRQMVRAELGKMLASDPTVQIGRQP